MSEFTDSQISAMMKIVGSRGGSANSEAQKAARKKAMQEINRRWAERPMSADEKKALKLKRAKRKLQKSARKRQMGK